MTNIKESDANIKETDANINEHDTNIKDPMEIKPKTQCAHVLIPPLCLVSNWNERDYGGGGTNR